MGAVIHTASKCLYGISWRMREADELESIHVFGFIDVHVYALIRLTDLQTSSQTCIILFYPVKFRDLVRDLCCFNHFST